MPPYEYKVIPAPDRGVRAKGVKRPEDRFALALSQVMNSLGKEGWEYVRADILPARERAGLASKQTVYHNMLVFRRALADADTLPLPTESEAPAPLAPDTAEPGPADPPPDAEEDAASAAPDDAPDPQEDENPPLAAQ